MSSNAVVLKGCQRPSILALPSERRGSTGPGVVHLAASAGLVLDDWQAWVLSEALSEQDDGRWSAFEVGVVVARQNGKGSILEARQLAGLTFLHEALQVHTAHEFKTASEHFLRMITLVESSPEIERKVMRIRRGAGEQAIEMRGGERLRFLARSGGSGRGLSGDVVYLDEAFALTPPMMGALLPTLSARQNPQVWYCSSAPLSSSDVLHNVRTRAMAGGSDRMFYAEWGNDPGVEVGDVGALCRANPALGGRILVESVDAERAAMPEHEFIRERLGVPDAPESDVERLVKIDPVDWANTIAPPPEAAVGLVAAVDVSPGSEWCSVAVASGSLGAPFVQVVEHRRGVGWLPAWLVEFLGSASPRVVGIDAGGPAGAVVGSVLAALQDAGIPGDKLRVVPLTELRQGCAAFHADVVEGRLKRPDGQGPLDVAVADAAERTVGDGWLWDRRNATVPISPLVAVTIARSLLLPDDSGPGSGGVVSLADYFDDEDGD